MPRSIYYPADQLEQCQMDRIENIEEIFHGQLAPAAGIEQKRRDSQQAPQLVTAQIQPEDHQAQRKHPDVYLPSVQFREALALCAAAVLEHSREHRRHTSPKAVIDLQDLI